MTLKQLQYFMAVARSLNFTEAAKGQYISQPALSRSVADLEDELNLSLLSRNRHSVSLTPAGTLLASELPRLKMELERLIIMVRQTEDGLMGRLNVGILDGQQIDEAVLVSFEYFRQSLPFVEITPRCLTFKEMSDGLSGNTLDIAVTMNHGLSNDHDFEILELDSIQSCIAIPDRHPHARKKSAPLSSFASDTFIVIDNESMAASTKFLLDACHRAGFTPHLKTVSDMRTQLLWIQSGFGISIFNTKSSAFSSSGLKAIPLTDTAFSKLVLVWRKDTKNPCVRLFVHLTQCCQ